ncbi:receptor-type tyrosine-protein phosphatase T-like [Glandiceps talaboti]
MIIRFLFFPCFLIDARLDITFFNLHAEPTSSDTDHFIAGYSAGDSVTSVGNSFTYGRVLDTGTGTDLPDNSYERDFNDYARRLFLRGGDQQPGVYYCEAIATNGETERLHTVVIRSDADIKAEGHTKTVSWGEAVTLSMTTSIQQSSLRWKHNGDDISEWNGLKSITITFAETSDGGVYECYSSESTSQRSQGKHGMMKLIVSECPNGKHGETCQLSCPTCYNGGVCNATIGVCICPPGFQGDNCQTACGKNRWGAECGRKCSSGNDNACKGKMFCVADPYGCSCSTSYTDLDCEKTCPSGMYGAGCTQTCHCVSGCNAATGCQAGNACAFGWSGDYCNVPVSCSDGMYGALCNYNCHCKDNAACDKNTGVCPNGECAPGWIPLSNNECQGKGIPKVTEFYNDKVNPGEETSFTCESYGNPGPASGSNEIQVQLIGSSSWLTPNNIQEESSYLYAATFNDVTVNAGEQYFCFLQIYPFRASSQTITVDVYDLPRFASTNTPTVMVEATEATISWQKWDESTDIGDGPVEAYTVYYKQTGENDWTLHEDFTVQDPSKTSYSTTITGLQWSTSYDFTVTVKRPGPNGEGSKDAYITEITLCDEPTEGPTITSTNALSPNAIQFNIKVPSSPEIKCNYGGTDGYIESFVIRYKKANSRDDYEMTTGNIGTATSFRIDGLLAYTEYEIEILFNNKDEQSPWSSPETERTDEDVPSEPRNVTLDAQASTIDVQWLIPEPVNGVINQYIIKYWKVEDENNEMINVTDNLQDINIYRIHGLQYEESYYVQVGAVTGAGLGEYSEATMATTMSTIPGMPETVIVSKITENSMEVSWTEPAVFSGDIKHYGVEYISGDSVFTNTKADSKSFLFDGDIFTYTLTDLSAGTTYEIKVNASTSKGFGEPNTVVTGTTFTVDVSEELSYTEDHNQPTSFTDTTAAVTLPQLSEESSLSSDSTPLDYIIVAEYDEPSARRRKREVDPDQLSSYNDSNVPYYITASIPLEDLPLTFIIGDGGVYGGYLNAPLTPGRLYYIYYGFASDISGETSYSLDSTPNTQIPADRSTDQPGSSTGAIVGGVIGALLLCAIIIVAIFFLRRYNGFQHTKDSKGNGHLHQEEFNDQNTSDSGYPQTTGDSGYQNVYYNTQEDMNSKLNESDDAQPYANVNELKTDKKSRTNGATNLQPEPTSSENIVVEIPDQEKPPKFRKSVTGKPNVAAKPQSGKPTLTVKPLQDSQQGRSAKPEPAPKPTGIQDTEHVIKVEDLSEYIMKKRGADEFKTEYKALPQGQIKSVDAAKIPENVKKNRFRNILAYDHSRVVLEPKEGDPNSDYINASYIDGYKKEKAYIATQGPNPLTVDDLWRMIWQKNITSILMATNLVENGKVKCHQYWPEKDGTWYGDIYVSLEKTEMFANYNIRTFHIQMENTDCRVVKQFHFTVWPDMGVPIYATAVLDVLEHFKNSLQEDAGPPLIHCSAGVGRTGTFIAIDVMLQMAKEEGKVDIFNFVKKARENRMHFVQVEDQYEFIHTALMEATVCGSTAIPATDFRQVFGKLFKVDKETKTTPLEVEWENLRKVSRVPRQDECANGSSSENSDKNRFPDVLPFNKQRPHLMTAVNEPGSNGYINASFVSAYIQKNAFLVTQMPMPNTVIDFWRMVYDYKSYSIVMLNDMDSNDTSIGKYWPEDDAMNIGPFKIDMLSRDVKGNLIIRTLQLTDHRGKTRTIQQYQVTGWPADQNMPKQKGVFIEIMTMVEKWQQQTGNGPVTVHCINGIGRSGVYCAAVSACDRIKVEQIVDVFQAVKTLRASRPYMVETKDQYRLCYEIVLDYFESFDTYANFQ